VEDEFVEADDEISWLYNQELKVTKEDIPVVLTELTDAAVSYIKKDDFEKALILL